MADFAIPSVGTLAGNAIDKILAPSATPADQAQGGNDLGAAIVGGIWQKAAIPISIVVVGAAVMIGVSLVWAWRTVTR